MAATCCLFHRNIVKHRDEVQVAQQHCNCVEVQVSSAEIHIVGYDRIKGARYVDGGKE